MGTYLLYPVSGYSLPRQTEKPSPSRIIYSYTDHSFLYQTVFCADSSRPVCIPFYLFQKGYGKIFIIRHCLWYIVCAPGSSYLPVIFFGSVSNRTGAGPDGRSQLFPTPNRSIKQALWRIGSLRIFTYFNRNIHDDKKENGKERNFLFVLPGYFPAAARNIDLGKSGNQLYVLFTIMVSLCHFILRVFCSRYYSVHKVHTAQKCQNALPHAAVRFGPAATFQNASYVPVHFDDTGRRSGMEKCL